MAKKRHPADVRRKKRRRRKRLKRFLVVLCVLAVLTFVLSLVYTVFHLKSIEVTGNQYTSTEEITAWIKQGDFSDNSLYVWWRYNRDNIKQLPSVTDVKVKLKSPNKVEVQVNEKELIGRVDCGDKFLYFDINGTACLVTADILEGVPYIEGVELTQEDIVLGEMIPAEDEKIFAKVSEVSKYLSQLELSPDRIFYNKDGLTLYLGDICVMLGTDGFKEKLSQVPPILQKLNEQYPGQVGTLHLENYENGSATVRFVPAETE